MKPGAPGQTAGTVWSSTAVQMAKPSGSSTTPAAEMRAPKISLSTSRVSRHTTRNVVPLAASAGLDWVP